MHRNDIETEIHSFVITNFLFGQPLELNSDDSLLEKGIIDSTGVLEMVAFLEERFAIKVEDEEVIPDNLDSKRKIASYVEKKLGCAV